MSRERDDDPPEAEMNAIEATLGSLVPARGRVDRDRIMFEAGRASVRPASMAHRSWMAIAAGFALVASCEAAMLARRPAAQVVEGPISPREPAATPRIAKAPAPSIEPRPSSNLAEAGPSDHDRLAWQVLRYGLDGLPASTSPAGSAIADRPATPRQLLRQELLEVLEPGGHS